jgi:hypothetical protein
MSEAILEALPLASLPALKQPLEGGIFCGVITLPDGKHYAVVKLDARPPKRLVWQKAMDWAKSVGGQLPSRAIAALLFSVAKELFEPEWHWTDEPEGSSYAWGCGFDYGGRQYYRDRSAGGAAVAVRLIPLNP